MFSAPNDDHVARTSLGNFFRVMTSNKGKGFVSVVPVKIKDEMFLFGTFYSANTKFLAESDREFILRSNPKEEAIFITHLNDKGLSALTKEKFSPDSEVLNTEIVVSKNELAGAVIKIA